MKTSELTGAELDYWVAKALGLELCRREDLGLIPVHPSMDLEVWCLTHADTARLDEMFGDAMHERTEDGYFRDWNPSIDWKQGGPIIEREKITIIATTGVHGRDRDLEWSAQVGAFSHYIDESLPLRRFEEPKSPTPLIAAMRVFVSSRIGDDVDATA